MAGTTTLTLEQEAAYLRVVCAINLYDEPVPADLRVLGGLWRCNERKAQRLLDELMATGKIQISDGVITNSLAMEDVSRRNGLAAERESTSSGAGVHQQSTSSAREVHGENSPTKSLKNNESGPQPNPLEKKDKTEKKEKIRGADIDKAYEAWNEVADRHERLPGARQQKGPTRDRLIQRLQQVGLDGWLLAMQGLEKSPWHLNEDRWDGMNLHWATGKENLAKLMAMAEKPEPRPPGGSGGGGQGGAGQSFWEAYQERHRNGNQ